MRRIAFISMMGVMAVAAACGDDDPNNAPVLQYTLVPPTGGISVRQDSAVPLGVTVMREGTTDPIQNVRLLYSSEDTEIATVDINGNVRGIKGGNTVVTASGPGGSIDVPVEVRPYTATSVELSVLSGPASAGIIGTRLNTNLDTGTFYALPADPGSSRLKAVVRVGTDTVYCNYCPVTNPPKPQRIVRFRSLNEALATVSNATDPTVQDANATAGRVTALDTSSAGVKIVVEVPADGIADTATLFLKLRPIDTLRIRPDSNFFPTANGTGLSKQIYPNADTIQANVKQASNTNFIAGVTFLSRVRDLPAAGSSTSPTATSLIRTIALAPIGAVTVRRLNLPQVTWESANVQYLQINAAGGVVAPCAFIGGACPTQGSVLTCNSNAGTMPATFLGEGNYTIPSCTPTKTIPFPGALCTSTSSTDLSSTCTIWIRATATDPATGKVLRRLYRINVGR